MTQVAQPQTTQSPAAQGTAAQTTDEQLRLQATERALVREFGPVLGEELVRSGVQDVVHRYDDAPVRTFLSVLVEREARARLRALSADAAR